MEIMTVKKTNHHQQQKKNNIVYEDFRQVRENFPLWSKEKLRKGSFSQIR